MSRMERFTTPPSFEEVGFSQGKCPLDMKDVSKSRKELWLIRAPLGFDSSTRNDVMLDLDGHTVEFSSEGSSKKYEALTVRQLKEKENGGRSPYLLLPSQEGTKLEPGPAFKGQIVIMESLSLSPSSQGLPGIVKSEAPKMPEGLRQRFKPFGWEKPKQRESSPSSSRPKKPSSPRNKQIKEENAQNDEVLERLTQLETVGGEQDPESNRKMKKVAKRKHEKKEVEEETSRPEHTDDVLNEGEETPRIKKKKKKSKEK